MHPIRETGWADSPASSGITGIDLGIAMPEPQHPVRFRDLSTSLRAALVAYFGSLLLMFVGVYTGHGHPPRICPVTLGTSGALTGLLLATNYQDAGTLYARWALRLSGRVLGIEFVQSMFAQPWFIRAFGLAFALVGLVFVVAGNSFA